MLCVYCRCPLICNACDVEFEPQSREQYEAMSHPETPMICPSCEKVVVCHWCRTAYHPEVEED